MEACTLLWTQEILALVQLLSGKLFSKMLFRVKMKYKLCEVSSSW